MSTKQPATIGDLGPPTSPKPGPRRSACLQAQALAPELDARLLRLLGPLRAIRVAFELGQRFGHGRLGDLIGCKKCQTKSIAPVCGVQICLLCGEGGDGVDARREP